MEGGGFGEPCVIAVFSKSNRSCNGVIDDDAFGRIVVNIMSLVVPVIQSK
jgi:hypothetical protein